MKRYYRIGTVFDIKIVLHYSWFIVFFFLSYVLARDYFPINFPGLSTAHYALIGVLSAIFLFVSVLAHELSHSLVAKHFKIPIKRIQLFFFGGLAEINDSKIEPRQELLMAIAGPIFSIIFGILCLYILPFSSTVTLTAILHYLGRINLVLGIFNLMPGFPLDGGRALRAVLWMVSGNYEKSTYIATRSGKFFGGFLIFLGIFSIIAGNFGGLWFVFLGGFLFFIAEMSFEQVVIKKSLMSVKVKDVYQKSFDFVYPDQTVDIAIKKVITHSPQEVFPVLKNKRFLGAITLSRIKSVPDPIRSKMKIKSLMVPAKKIKTVKLSDDIYPLLMRMAKNGNSFLPVLKFNKLVGIVTKGSIVHYLRLKK